MITTVHGTAIGMVRFTIKATFKGMVKITGNDKVRGTVVHLRVL